MQAVRQLLSMYASLMRFQQPVCLGQLRIAAGRIAPSCLAKRQCREPCLAFRDSLRDRNPRPKTITQISRLLRHSPRRLVLAFPWELLVNWGIVASTNRAK